MSSSGMLLDTLRVFASFSLTVRLCPTGKERLCSVFMTLNCALFRVSEHPVQNTCFGPREWCNVGVSTVDAVDRVDSFVNAYKLWRIRGKTGLTRALNRHSWSS